MEDTTKYERLTDFFLDNWIIASIILLFVAIAFIPSLRDGTLEVLNLTKKLFRLEQKNFIIKHKGERIILEYKTKSIHFDIIKIHATTHILGVNAEYKWKNKYYPKYKMKSQELTKIEVNENESLYYDVLLIENENGLKKRLYFDISSFYNDGGHTSLSIDKFAREKIKELIKKN